MEEILLPTISRGDVGDNMESIEILRQDISKLMNDLHDAHDVMFRPEGPRSVYMHSRDHLSCCSGS